MLTKQPNRPFCANCKTTLAKFNGYSKHGFKMWHKYCVECAKMKYNPKYRYLELKQGKCSFCGFIAKDRCQIDLLYKDGNKKNKDPSNIIPACANCSRLYRKQLKQKSILDITVDADVTIG